MTIANSAIVLVPVSLVLNVKMKYVDLNVGPERVKYLTMVPVCTVIVLVVSLGINVER